MPDLFFAGFPVVSGFADKPGTGGSQTRLRQDPDPSAMQGAHIQATGGPCLLLAVIQALLVGK